MEKGPVLSVLSSLSDIFSVGLERLICCCLSDTWDTSFTISVSKDILIGVSYINFKYIIVNYSETEKKNPNPLIHWSHDISHQIYIIKYDELNVFCTIVTVIN